MPRKKEETQEPAAASEMAENASMAVQADAENMENAVDTENNENTVTGSEDAMPDSPVDSAVEEKKPGADETPAGQDASEKDESVENPGLEQENSLVNLSVLADRHRIPSWQQAALLRYMGWQDDRLVSDEEYKEALQALKTRRIGGGRR